MTDSRPSTDEFQRALERDYADAWDELEDVSEEFADVRPRKDRQLNLRVDDGLLAALRSAAAQAGESYHAFARRLIEEGVARALDRSGTSDERSSASAGSESFDRPFHTKEVLLVLLGQAGPGGQENEPIEGRTRLQKLLFLTAQHLKADVSARFEAYDYGPFDEEVGPDLEFLASEGLVEWEGRSGEPSAIDDEDERGARILEWVRGRASGETPQMESYRLTQLGLEWVARFFSSDAFGSEAAKERLADECRRLKARFGRVPLEELVDHVYHEYPDFTEHSKIRHVVAERRARKSSTRSRHR